MYSKTSGFLLYLPLFLIIVALIALSGFFGQGESDAAVLAYSPTMHIYDDATGGDCASIGTWDAASKTCTLGTDLYFAGDGIEIAGAGITLDGNGHILTGTTYGDGVYSWGFNDVTVRNLRVEHFHTKGISISGSSGATITNNQIIEDYYGILFYQSSGNTVTGNTVWASGNQGISLNSGSNDSTVSGNTISQAASFGSGISVWDSSGNIVSGNDVVSTKMYGIGIVGTNNTVRDNIAHNSGAGITLGRFGQVTSSNVVVGNNFSSNKYGVWFYEGNANIVTGNTVSGSLLNGVRLLDSSSNSIYNNSFSANATQVSIEGTSSGNVFNLAAPAGGNYWDTWNTPDTDSDGFVDAPFVFAGGQDSLPYSTTGGYCKAPSLGLNRQSVYWASVADYNAGILSVDYTVDSFFDVYNEAVVASANTNAVVSITPLPMNLGESINAGSGASMPVTFQYAIPPGVTNFLSITYASADDVCGNTYFYPGPPPGP